MSEKPSFVCWWDDQLEKNDIDTYGAEKCAEMAWKAQEAYWSKRVKEYEKALEWLENKVYEGKGTIDFLLTEDGDIGVFRGTERFAMGSGSTPLEAIQSAMKSNL